jgi:hypothetical protein
MSVARTNSLPAPRALPRRALIVTARDLLSLISRFAQWWNGVRAAGNALNRGLVGHNIVVSQEEVRVRAVEHHDGHAVVLLDLGEQIMQRDDHHGVDEVDWRVVEGHAP